MILFIGLLKKDLKISLPFFYKTLVIILVSLIVGSGFSGYYGKMDALTAISIALVIVQMFCLPAAVFQSLNIEGKTQLWLHNPASSLKLLLSKNYCKQYLSCYFDSFYNCFSGNAHYVFR